MAIPGEDAEQRDTEEGRDRQQENSAALQPGPHRFPGCRRGTARRLITTGGPARVGRVPETGPGRSTIMRVTGRRGDPGETGSGTGPLSHRRSATPLVLDREPLESRRTRFAAPIPASRVASPPARCGRRTPGSGDRVGQRDQGDTRCPGNRGPRSARCTDGWCDGGKGKTLRQHPDQATPWSARL